MLTRVIIDMFCGIAAKCLINHFCHAAVSFRFLANYQIALIRLTLPLSRFSLRSVRLLQHPTYYQFGYQVSDKYTQDYHGHMEHNSGELTHGKTDVRIMNDARAVLK